MFTVYMRDDSPGGDVFNETRHDTADAAEASAFQMLADASASESVTITADGGWSNGSDGDGPWGGEFILSNPIWESDCRLVLSVDED